MKLNSIRCPCSRVDSQALRPFPSPNGKQLPHFCVMSFFYFPHYLMTLTVKSLPAMQETWVQSLGQEDLLEKEGRPKKDGIYVHT